jgi:hypothetical protein
MQEKKKNTTATSKKKKKELGRALSRSVGSSGGEERAQVEMKATEHTPRHTQL